MKKSCNFLVVLFLPLWLYGQKKILEGQVLDSSDKPLVGAEIKVSEGGGTQILLSDSKGFFKYAAEREDLWVSAAYQGASFYEAKIKLVRDTFLLLRYVPQSEKDSKTLDTAIVRGYKKSTLEAQADRFVFTPNEELKAGKSVTDLLNATPMLQFEQANRDGEQDVQVIGKESTDIYINGRRTFVDKSILLQMLQGQDAGDIEKIEIIRNPNVSYDVRPGGAVVNIIMKKNNLNGVTGNARLSGTRNSFTGYSGNVNLDYNFYKFNAKIGVYGGNFLQRYFRNGDNNFISLGNYVQNSVTSNPWRYNYFGGFDVGLSYDLSAKQTLQLNQNFGYGDRRSVLISNNIFRFPTKMDPDSSFGVNVVESALTISSQTDLNYVVSTDNKGSKFEVFFNYMFYRDNTENTTNIEKDKVFSVNYLQQVPRSIHSFYLGAQYTQVFNQKHSVQAGVKGYYTHTNNPVIYRIKNVENVPYQPYPELSNHLVYQEPVYSVFLLHNGHWHPKFQSVLGVKLDHTRQIGTVAEGGSKSLSRNWLFFLPTVSLNYVISKNHYLNYAFNSSVDKPAISSLNPYRYVLSNNFYVEGNPFLLVSRIYSQSLSYTLFQKYTLLADYDYTLNPELQVPTVQSGSIYYGIVRSNVPYQHRLNLGFAVNEYLFKGRWQVNVTAMAIYVYANGDNEFFKILSKGWGVQLKMNHTVVLNAMDHPNKWLLNVSYNQLFRYIFAFGDYKTGPNVGLGVTKQYRQWTFNVLLQDPFRSAQQMAIMRATGLAHLTNVQYYDQRSVRVSVSYRFGNASLKTKRKMRSGNENEGRTK